MDDIEEKSIKFIKRNKKLLINKFASLDNYNPVIDPLTFFMAGSPGAGKTEYSKGFIEELKEEQPDIEIVRIDPDEIRSEIPGYDGKNSWQIQRAASFGVEPILDHVLHKNLNFILDGTFSNYEKSRSNIIRCLKHNRRIGIKYIYLKPDVAWGVTKKREKLNGRFVPKEAFIKEFFLAKENVQKIKDEFGSDVHIYLVLKDDEKSVKKTLFEVDKVDSFIDKKYTKEELEDLISKTII